MLQWQLRVVTAPPPPLRHCPQLHARLGQPYLRYRRPEREAVPTVSGAGAGGCIYRNQSGPGGGMYNNGSTKASVFTVTRAGPSGGIYGKRGPVLAAVFTVTRDGPGGGIYGNGGRARGGL